MKCPKCGQETISINNRDVCTVCGVVYGSSTPKEQVLTQIKEKVLPQKESGKEVFVSPIEKHLENLPTDQKDRFNQTDYQKIPPKTALKTEEETQIGVTSTLNISNEAAVNPLPSPPNKDDNPSISSNQSLPQKTPIVTQASASRVGESAAPKSPAISISSGPTPEVPSLGGTTKDNTQKPSVQMQSNVQNIPQTSTSNPAQSQVINQGTAIKQEDSPNLSSPTGLPLETNVEKEKGFLNRVVVRNLGRSKENTIDESKMVLEENTPQLYSQNSGDETGNLYPSHQINPIFIKILLILFLLALVFIAVYIVYLNISGVRVTIDSLIKYLGMNLFK